MQPQNTASSKFKDELLIVIVVNDVHDLNAESPIEVTLFGIVILVNDEHEENTYLPIDVTLFDIVIFVNDVHEENA